MPSLGTLFPNLFEASPHTGLAISGITADSRTVRAGMAFVALSGSSKDGAAFILDAVTRGAVAVVGDGPPPDGLPAHIPYGRTRDARLALAFAAAWLYPHQPENVVAVTGTNGKSSVADFTRQILNRLGHKSASLGTLGLVSPAGTDPGALTTPDPVTLHRILDRLAGEGVTHLAMEASSHGLEQRRLDGVRLLAGAFTNLGRDHLDYHSTVLAYLKAKMRLFDTVLPEGAFCVVNTQGYGAAEVLAEAAVRGLTTITVGGEGDDLALIATRQDGFAQRLTVLAEGETRTLHFPLIGAFQASNALVAAGLAIACGCNTMEVIGALEHLEGVPGRMERVAEIRGALCVVDYAHKPEALEAVLKSLRPYATGALVCVFGCGGDRDRGKRPIMGRIAVENADRVIVTDDNPRSENAKAIRMDILAAAPGAIEIDDRATAIQTAVRGLKSGDVLVVAGKGHETGQSIEGITRPFSDRDEIRRNL